MTGRQPRAMLAWPPERSSSLETDVTAGVLIMEELPAGRFSADSLLPGEMLSAGHGAGNGFALSHRYGTLEP
jgi:hypothetical protein